MSDIIKVAKKGNKELRIVIDPEPYNPRENDNIGHMVIWHNNYRLGDEKFTRENFPTVESFDEFVAKQGRKIVIFPVFAYEHGDIILSTNNSTYPFNDRWDAYQCGYIYATWEDILKNFNRKRVTQKLADMVIDILKGEIETYNQYLTNTVYGYEEVEISDCSDEETIIDSCYGYYGKLEDLIKDAAGNFGIEWKDAKFEDA